MVQTAQTVVHFAHFQVQAQLALPGSTSRAHCAHACSQVSVYCHLSLGPQFALKVATHCCVVVYLCIIQDQSDQSDTTEINQIQLQSRDVPVQCMQSSFCIPPPFTGATRLQPCASDRCICSDLDLAVTLHSLQLTRYWGQPACWALCTFQVS